MPIEQRVIASKSKPSTGTIGAKGGSSKKDATEPVPTKSRKPLIAILVIALVLALGAVGYLVLAKPSSGAAAPAPAPSPGQVVKVDAMTVNLADGRFLRLGFALQLSTEVKTAPDTSVAADRAIALWSGRSVDEVSNPTVRDQLKAQLLTDLADRFGKRVVLAVYLTDYVTQ